MRFAALIVAIFVAANPLGWDQFGPLRFALVSTLGFVAIGVSLGTGDTRATAIPRWATIGWGLLFFATIISTALSDDPWHALIGTPERHFGLATWFLLVGLFATVSLTPRTMTAPVVGAAQFGGFISGLWAVLERWEIGWFATDFANDRAGGPFGQPAFLGAAMTISVPLAVANALDAGRPRVERLASAVAAAFGTTALILSGSRAAWVGALVALVAVVLRRRAIRSGLLAAAAIAALLALTPVGARASTLLDTDTGVVAGRVDEWQVGLRALFASDTNGVFGHGPEGYRLVFGEHIDEDYVLSYGRDVLTDRAHNNVLDVALTGGIVGAVGYALLGFGLVSTALRRMKAEDLTDVGLAAACVGYLGQQFFLFPLSEIDPLFWLAAGLLVARRPVRAHGPGPLLRQFSSGRRIATFATFGVAALAGVAGVSDVAADRAIVDVAALTDAAERDDRAALARADEARSRRPDSIRYDFIASRTVSRSQDEADLREALDRLDHGLGISPQDPALLIERGDVLLQIARTSGDEADLDIALDALADLADRDRLNPRVLNAHAIALSRSGDLDSAATAFGQAAKLDPDNIEFRANAATAAFEAGDRRTGIAQLEVLEELAPGNATAESLRREFLRQ